MTSHSHHPTLRRLTHGWSCFLGVPNPRLLIQRQRHRPSRPLSNITVRKGSQTTAASTFYEPRLQVLPATSHAPSSQPPGKASTVTPCHKEERRLGRGLVTCSGSHSANPSGLIRGPVLLTSALYPLKECRRLDEKMCPRRPAWSVAQGHEGRASHCATTPSPGSGPASLRPMSRSAPLPHPPGKQSASYPGWKPVQRGRGGFAAQFHFLPLGSSGLRALSILLLLSRWGRLLHLHALRCLPGPGSGLGLRKAGGMEG